MQRSDKQRTDTVSTSRQPPTAGPTRRTAHHIVQRARAEPHALTAGDVTVLQRMLGNRATTRLLQPVLQAKLKLGPAADKYEQEADRVAEQVVNTTPSAPVQRASAGDRLEEEEIQAKPLTSAAGLSTAAAPKITRLQRVTFRSEPLQQAQAHGPEGGNVDASVAQQIQRARGGQPLAESVRRRIRQPGEHTGIDGTAQPQRCQR